MIEVLFTDTNETRLLPAIAWLTEGFFAGQFMPMPVVGYSLWLRCDGWLARKD